MSEFLRDPAFLIAAAMVAAGAVVVARELEPAWLLSIGVCLSIFSGNWGNAGVPVPIDRAVMALGLLSVAWRMWDQRHASPDHLRPMHLLLVAVLGYALVSGLAAGTFTQDVGVVFSLLDTLGFVPFALYVAAPWAFGTARQRRILLGSLLVTFVYLGGTAVLETAGLRELVYPRYIDNPYIGSHHERARGPFAEAGGNGFALVLGLVVAGVVWSTTRREEIRFGSLVIAAMCAIGVVGTLTRQIWLAAALAGLAGMLVVPRMRRWAVPTLIVAAILAVGTITLVPGLQDRVDDRAASESPVWDRANSNNAGLRMLAERPVQGWGWGAFPTRSPAFYRQADDYPLTTVAHLHNVPLSHAVELGVPGALLWLAALLAALWRAWKSTARPDLWPWRASVVAIFLSWLVIANLSPATAPFGNYVLWMWLGIAAAVGMRRPAPAAQRRPVAPPPRELVPA